MTARCSLAARTSAGIIPPFDLLALATRSASDVLRHLASRSVTVKVPDAASGLSSPVCTLAPAPNTFREPVAR
eukprot:15478621-Alexandrium_andersonii.AAC.1